MNCLKCGKPVTRGNSVKSGRGREHKKCPIKTINVAIGEKRKRPDLIMEPVQPLWNKR
ncbi:MAG: hypothetical protein PHU23_06010 [Dehalococcoidales bacterium]|nr:hypothetical protein [Dehalococcoidales bacterium]